MKPDFLSMVSHELLTPPTSIPGFANITRRRLSEISSRGTRCPEDVNKGLDRIGSNTDVIIVEGERLTELINNVLDLFKLEVGRFEWHMTEVCMNEVLKHCLSQTEALNEGAGFVLTHDIPDPLPHVTGDHNRLVQVVVNLLSNAVKFTEEGFAAV